MRPVGLLGCVALGVYADVQGWGLGIIVAAVAFGILWAPTLERWLGPAPAPPYTTIRGFCEICDYHRWDHEPRTLRCPVPGGGYTETTYRGEIE